MNIVNQPLSTSNRLVEAVRDEEVPEAVREEKADLDALHTMSLVGRAVLLATRAHDGKTLGVTPYICYLLGVSSTAQTFGYHPDTLTADEMYVTAVLHTVLQETEVLPDTLELLFPSIVVKTVRELTDVPADIKAVGRLRYHQTKMVTMTDGAFYIKLCSLLHTLSLSPSQDTCEEIINLVTYVWSKRHIRRPLIPLMAKILELSGRKMKWVDDHDKLPTFYY